MIEREINELKEAHAKVYIIDGRLRHYTTTTKDNGQLQKHLSKHDTKLMIIFKKFYAKNSGFVPKANFRECRVKCCSYLDLIDNMQQ